MQVERPASVHCRINVTPLVDVVLVLLIIFMVVAPQLESGPDVQLPTTDEPPERPENGRQILIAIEQGGVLWVDSDQVTVEQLPQSLEQAAQSRGDWQVVIKGDARLTFGEVQQAMLAVDRAGFRDVGLIAERQNDGRTEE